MEIKIDVPLAFPRALVFTTYRDNLDALADRLPNVRSVSVKRHEDQPGEVRMVVDWRGGSDIPAFARAFVSESMLTWTDHLTWKEASFTEDWRIDVHAFPGAVTIAGTSYFVETGEGTRIEFRGELNCDLSKVSGVPRFMAKSLKGTAEKFILSKVADNLAAIGRAVGQILEQRAR